MLLIGGVHSYEWLCKAKPKNDQEFPAATSDFAGSRIEFAEDRRAISERPKEPVVLPYVHQSDTIIILRVLHGAMKWPESF